MAITRRTDRPALQGPNSDAARRNRTQAGWTIVELLVVISLVSTLAGIAMIGYGTAVTRSREAVLKEDLFRIRDAIDQYYADKNEYPPLLDSLVGEGYLRAIPVDPFTQSATSWQPILAEYDPSNPLSQGVFDIRSGAQGQAVDGTVYAEW